MDLETAQRIERLEYLVEMLCRHQGLDAERLLGPNSTLPPLTGRPPVEDAVPTGYGPAAPVPAPMQSGPVLPPAFYEYVRAGKQIHAIKVYREVTGASLKEAKDFVDRFRSR